MASLTTALLEMRLRLLPSLVLILDEAGREVLASGLDVVLLDGWVELDTEFLLATPDCLNGLDVVLCFVVDACAAWVFDELLPGFISSA